MTWLLIVVSALAGGLFGGLVGSWTTAFRWGRRWQNLVDRMEAAERRLAKGDPLVGNVPILTTRVEMILEELRIIKSELRDDRARFVTHEECDRRHEPDGA